MDKASLTWLSEQYGLDAEGLARLRTRRIQLQRDDTLFRAGEQYQGAIFLLLKGSAGAQYPNAPLKQLKPGAWLGLPNLLDHSPYASTTLILENAEFLRIEAASTADLEQAAPGLLPVLRRIIAERMREGAAAGTGLSGALAQPVRLAMKAPLSTCECTLSLREAYQIMRARGMGSLGVLDPDGKLLGILTHASMAEALLEKNARPEDPVCQTETYEHSHVIAPDTPLWQAEEAQRQHRAKYLVVVENGQPLGILSQTDILKTLFAQRGALLAKIQSAQSLQPLRALYLRMADVAREAQQTHHHISAAVRSISDTHLALQRRCIDLTRAEIEAEFGPPPAEYALLIMGSGGRREMLLNPDQDNGLIIGPCDDTDQAKRWFQHFSERVNQRLDEVGYILCPGDIMARNPLFHKMLDEWRQQFAHVAAKPTEKAARWANIMFDFTLLHGDGRLVEELRSYLLSLLAKQPRLLTMMVRDDAEGRAPLGLFNRLLTETDAEHRGKIDIKRNGLRIIADAARIFSLRAGIGATHTADRLDALMREGVLKPELAESVSAAYDGLLGLLLAHQIRQLDADEPLDKYIAPDKLSFHNQETLRLALRTVRRFQEELQSRFDAVDF